VSLQLCRLCISWGCWRWRRVLSLVRPGPRSATLCDALRRSPQPGRGLPPPARPRAAPPLLPRYRRCLGAASCLGRRYIRRPHPPRAFSTLPFIVCGSRWVEWPVSDSCLLAVEWLGFVRRRRAKGLTEEWVRASARAQPLDLLGPAMVSSRRHPRTRTSDSPAVKTFVSFSSHFFFRF